MNMDSGFYFLRELLIDGKVVKPNEDPNIYLKDKYNLVYTRFDKENKRISLCTDPILTRDCYKVPLIINSSLSPTKDNKNISVSSLLCVTSDPDMKEDFSIGPLIIENKECRIYPGKLSLIGGFYEEIDIDFEHTAIRKFIEKIGLYSYMKESDIDIIKDKFLKGIKLTHVLFSHPLIDDKIREFNISFVYRIILTKYERLLFDYSKKEGLYKILPELKWVDILTSLFCISPFEEKRGWIPSVAVVIIDYIREIAPKQIQIYTQRPTSEHYNRFGIPYSPLEDLIKNICGEGIRCYDHDILEKFIWNKIVKLMKYFTNSDNFENHMNLIKPVIDNITLQNYYY